MTGNTDNKGKIIPQAMAELEWVWVLVRELGAKRETIFVIDFEERDGGATRRIVPLFENRLDAAKLKLQLCGVKSSQYAEQAMRLKEVGEFAAKNELEMMLLDENGSIMAHMEARIERSSIH
ncbi:DUF3110 domain-containing protein [Deltaproteobacteria bacterium OttesenSCG-928-K17]|nr:DUF3110 domain-containing protein [Deltaproteobacteria bacterium OttesenSCG-928-K17]